MDKTNIKIDEDTLLSLFGWLDKKENGVMNYTRTKNDLTSQQKITLTKKDKNMSFDWVEVNLEKGNKTRLFSFDVANGDIISSSPNLTSQAHFDALLSNISNTIRMMDVKPKFTFTGKQEKPKSRLM
jgi:hypothetical protein